MLTRRTAFALAAAALATLLVAGVIRLFALRYETGDVQPMYSSLRADPVGTKALYEALNATSGTTLRRNYRPLFRLQPATPDATIAAIGLGYEDGISPSSHLSNWEVDQWHAMELLIAGGARAVFAYRGEERDRREAVASGMKKGSDKEGKPEGSEAESRTKALAEKLRKLAESHPFGATSARWGFRVERVRSEKPWTSAFIADAELQPGVTGLEATVPWRSALYFSNLKPEWQVVYSCEGNPVVIERRWGQGSIVLAADSYFLSNEALRRHRSPLLLARLFDIPGEIVIDESHLGVSEGTGVMVLARKYRLGWVFAALGLVACLLFWRHALPFVPHVHSAERSGAERIRGRDAGEGFIKLLRRSIPPRELFAVCLGEWRKSATAAEQARLEAALPPGDKLDDVEAYGKAVAALKPR